MSMKILTASQLRDCDRFIMEHESILSIDLMERSARACLEWMIGNVKNVNKYAFFCGNGNNGGDGFALARLLYQKGRDVEVFTFPNQKFTPDALTNLKRIEEIAGIEVFGFEEALKREFNKEYIIIDALFGTGLNRNVEGAEKEIVQLINRQNAEVISIDIPSGLSADGYCSESIAVKADHTLSLQFWKRAFLHPETGIYCGKIHLLDIGLSKTFIEETATDHFVISEAFARRIYKPRSEFSHKGNFGKTCIIAGSFGKIGAAVLATQAALKTGSGLTFILAPKVGYEILQVSCPEAMFLYGGEDFVSKFETEEDFTLGIGPGLGADPETENVLLQFLENYSKPLVLDADALTILAANPEYLQFLPEQSIITPHPREFERLFGKTSDSFVRLELAKAKSAELKCIIVLKDHHTQVISPCGKVFYNVTGNSGMAKGGSGDVLTGIITSLLGQGYSSLEAAVLGVWLHGKAGDYAAEKYGKESMTASQITAELGNAFRDLI